jgi:hypothetical protein
MVATSLAGARLMLALSIASASAKRVSALSRKLFLTFRQNDMWASVIACWAAILSSALVKKSSIGGHLAPHIDRSSLMMATFYYVLD